MSATAGSPTSSSVCSWPMYSTASSSPFINIMIIVMMMVVVVVVLVVVVVVMGGEAIQAGENVNNDRTTNFKLGVQLANVLQRLLLFILIVIVMILMRGVVVVVMMMMIGGGGGQRW